MEMSVIGEQALIAREGRRLKAYRDSVGVWTIGVGVTTIDGKPVRKGMVITAAESDALFEKTLARYVAAVNRGLKVEVPQHAFDALCSTCYNIGIGKPSDGGFLGSTFLKRINERAHPDVIQAALLLWKKPAEIIPRRKAEALQFRTPYGVEMPRQVIDSDPLRIAATVSEALAPSVPTPVIPPVVLPAAPPSWWATVGRWIDETFGERKVIAEA